MEVPISGPNNISPNEKLSIYESSATSIAVISEDDDEPNIEGICGSQSSKEFRPEWKFYAIMTVFMVLTLSESANSTSTSTALVPLGRMIPNSTSAQLEWIGNSYMLTAAVFQLPIASASSIWGRKPLVLFSFALFISGSAIAGSAHNMVAISSGRTIQGIGGAGTLVSSESCIADLVPLRFRARYYSFLSVMWAVGSGVGPIIGGGFTCGPYMNTNKWRWIFYLNVPIAATALLVALFVFPSPDNDSGKHKEDNASKSGFWSCILSVSEIDFIGTSSIIAASTSFILGLTSGGVIFSWDSWHVLVPLFLGMLGFLCFGCYELWGTNRPMLSIKVLFVNRSAGIAFFHALIQGFMMEALPYYLPLFYQGVLLYSPLISGLALLPFAVIILLSSVVSGHIVSICGRYKWISAAGWIFLTTGLGLLLIPSEKNNTIGAWLGPVFPVSIGLGILYSVLSTSVQAPQSPPKWTDAAAMMSFVRSVGEAMGVAIGGAIYASRMTSQIQTLQLSLPVDPKESFELVHYINELPRDNPIMKTLQRASSNSMHAIYYLYLGLGALCSISNSFLKEFSLNQGNVECITSSGFHRKHSGRSNSSSDSDIFVHRKSSIDPSIQV